jgi:hypothetical protein
LPQESSRSEGRPEWTALLLLSLTLLQWRNPNKLWLDLMLGWYRMLM